MSSLPRGSQLLGAIGIGPRKMGRKGRAYGITAVEGYLTKFEKEEISKVGSGNQRNWVGETEKGQRVSNVWPCTLDTILG